MELSAVDLDPPTCNNTSLPSVITAAAAADTLVRPLLDAACAVDQTITTAASLLLLLHHCYSSVATINRLGVVLFNI